MAEIQKRKTYDLEVRTLNFAKCVNIYVNQLPKTVTNIENDKQLTRAAGSVGANYIEANESLSKKDFAMRIKICRKESKESRYWLELTEPTAGFDTKKRYLIDESVELTKIFGSIVEKTR